MIGAMRAAGSLSLPCNVVGVIALAENAIGPDAMYPHQILTSHAGKTVEVGNTDAEGRLCLADAMSWVQVRVPPSEQLHAQERPRRVFFAQETHTPSQMVDVATLTGACVVALGEYAAGAFANGEKEEQGKALEAALARAAATSAERIWPMPVFPEHTKELKGTYADLRSIGKGREGGACTAAAFLQEFVHDGVGWCHIDVAGPAMTSRPWVRGPLDATVPNGL